MKSRILLRQQFLFAFYIFQMKTVKIFIIKILILDLELVETIGQENFMMFNHILVINIITTYYNYYYLIHFKI